MLTQKRLLELAQIGLQKELADVTAMIGQSRIQVESEAGYVQVPMPMTAVSTPVAAPGRRPRTVPVVRPRAGQTTKEKAVGGRKTRTMTKEGRARIAAAQRERWSRVKNTKGTAGNEVQPGRKPSGWCLA